MLWRLKFGDQMKTAARAQAKGLPSPLDTAPQPYPGSEYIFSVFMDMSRARPVYGMGSIGAIPPHWIAATLDRYGYPDWQRRFMFRVLILLDDAYLRWAHKQKPSKSTRPQGPRRSGVGPVVGKGRR